MLRILTFFILNMMQITLTLILIYYIAGVPPTQVLLGKQ